MNNKKFVQGLFVIFTSIIFVVSCSSNSKPDEKKDWNGPTLTKGSSYNNTLDITIPQSGNIQVEIPLTVDTSVKDVTFEFVSGIEIDASTGADKTDRAAKIEVSDIVANSFKYEDGKIFFSILQEKREEINEKTMRLYFKVTSSSHKDYNLNVFVYFAQS